MFNPNYIYCLVFLSVIALYELGWSDLYPDLQFPLLLFLILSVLVNWIFGLSVSKLIKYKRANLPVNSGSLYVKLVTLILLIFWGIDIFFGEIPTFHIILITFSSFYSIYVFSRLLIEKKGDLLIVFIVLSLINIFFATYRILIFYNLITCLLTYIYIRNPLKSVRGKIIIVSCALGILFIFGYLGNNLKGSEYNDGELILTIGEANDNFKNSIVPKEFFWTFLYASSPLANLELNIENRNSDPPSFRNFWIWTSADFLPDFMSKKILTILHAKQIESLQVNDVLNVSTVYIRSYRYFSWYGLTVMAFYIAILPSMYLYLIRNSRFFIPGLVSMITIYMFLVFDNLFAFSAISFQLVYPVLGLITIKKKIIDE